MPIPIRPLDKATEWFVRNAAILRPTRECQDPLINSSVKCLRYCQRPGITGHVFVLADLVDGAGETLGSMLVERVGQGRGLVASGKSLVGVAAEDRLGMDTSSEALTGEGKYDVRFTIEFTPALPVAIDLLAIARRVSAERPLYTLLGSNCHWLASALCDVAALRFNGVRRPAIQSLVATVLISLTCLEGEVERVEKGFDHARRALDVAIADAKWANWSLESEPLS
ncbi:hypothetical protein B0H10DRAFT_1952577 [Mycena sp. CBHHK59/15]|nr:hypothetical protein B0H10DRAFT_1952577 [Mycena sp. CBHHK59/15]